MTFQKEVSIQTKFEEVLSRRKLCINAQQKKVHYECLCPFFFLSTTEIVFVNVLLFHT